MNQKALRLIAGHNLAELLHRPFGRGMLRHIPMDDPTCVGATTTYVALSPDDSLDRLPGRVLATLSSAMNRGELGHRFSMFQRYDRFFAGQLGGTTALFNHEGPFVGEIRSSNG